MIEGITEQELRQDLLQAKLLPHANARSSRIYWAAKSIVGSGSVYYVLSDTPEQTTDVFRVLVDDKAVAAFELNRKNLDAPPEEITVYTISDYKKAIGDGLAEAELRIAIELAREELGRQD